MVLWMNKPKVKILYILGTGHSGSTMMDILLGSHEKIASAGELVNFLSVRGNNRYCSCGEHVSDCEYWGYVHKLWRGTVGEEGVRDYPILQARYERIRSLPRLWVERFIKSKEFIKYGRLTRLLYEAIAEASGNNIIVDSSKNPARAYALHLIYGSSVKPILLVRDSRAVTWSYMKMAKKDYKQNESKLLYDHLMWSSILDWNFTNYLSLTLLNRFFADSITIKYEDIISDVPSSFVDIGQAIGYDLTGLYDEAEMSQGVEIKHIVAGNKTRKTGRLRIKPDVSWRNNMPYLAQRICRVFTWPLARKLGYN